MARDERSRAKEIFLRISEADAADRTRILAELCGDDSALRTEVLSLLHHGDLAPRGFLDPTTDAAQAAATAREAALPAFGPGHRIQDYEILRILGEGGMGIVYAARRPSDPADQEFALKVVKPGMDTRMVLSRFHFERQTLAMLSHDRIARLVDAGATDDGLPYIVMELVPGQPVHQFCREHESSVEERVQLVVQVAHAVQHAHGLGVIHRDIKSTNILVTPTATGPSATVIDFGIARLLSVDGSTSLTPDGRLLGTPEFMSPEQIAGPRGASVSSDIYSLGAVLYQLLTGTTPVPAELARNAGPSELQRLVAESRPRPPAAATADPADAAVVRGALEWITMKALAASPESRYATAGDLARDLESWLNGESVQATPRTAWQDLRAFAGRHRIAVACAALVTALLLGSLVVVSMALVETRQARAAERDAREEAEAVHQFVQRELMAAAAPEALGLDAPLQLVLHDAVRRFGRIFAGRPRVEIGVRQMLGETMVNCRRPDLAIMHWERAVSLSEGEFGMAHERTLRARTGLALALTDLERLSEARDLLEAIRDGLGAADVGPHADLAIAAQSQLGHTLALQGEARGLDMLRTALRDRREHFGPEHVAIGTGMRRLAHSLRRLGRGEEAVTAWENLREHLRRTLGETHPSTLAADFDLGMELLAEGQHGEALPPIRRVLASRAAALGADHRNTRAARERLIEALDGAGQRAEADRERQRLR